MYSKWRERLRHTLGFRLALWYAVIFVVSSLALTGLTYVLVAASLRQYDREIIGTALVQYAKAYQVGGVATLREEIQCIDEIDRQLRAAVQQSQSKASQTLNPCT